MTDEEYYDQLFKEQHTQYLKNEGYNFDLEGEQLAIFLISLYKKMTQKSVDLIKFSRILVDAGEWDKCLSAVKTYREKLSEKIESGKITNKQYQHYNDLADLDSFG